MARQQDGCWRCGAEWTTEKVAPTRLRVIAGGQLVRPVAELARAAAREDDDRWINDGGSVGPERVCPVPPVATTV